MQTKTITEKWDMFGGGKYTRNELIEMMDHELANLDEPLRESAKFGITRCRDDYASFGIFWERPETEQETAERLKKEHADKIQREESERRQYEALKKKFETA